MSKPIYTVREYIEKHEFTRHLRTAVVTFMLFSVTAAGADNVKYYADCDQTPVIETMVGGQNITLNRVVPSLSNAAFMAYNKLISRVPEAAVLEPVATFITEGIGDITAEHIVMDCDMSDKVLNVAYRLPGDLLLSINKPLDTMDDKFVIFNVYHKRNLLVSEAASIDLLAQYIRNIEKRITELA